MKKKLKLVRETVVCIAVKTGVKTAGESGSDSYVRTTMPSDAVR